MVFSASRRVLGNTADAEDLTQESFLKLCRLQHPVRNVAAWLHRVTTNGAIDVLRARIKRQKTEARRNVPATTQDDLQWQDIESFVDASIEALPESLPRI
jgi:DNA-directed RNA polymerase specialized sigma24 family protein